jgi:hypothetical protein
VKRRFAAEDVVSRPVVVATHALRFADGGDPSVDRTPHVRAASGITWSSVTGAPRLVVAQDDTSHLAIIDPSLTPPEVSAITLAHEVGGRRVFEARLGNKKHKLDLEACTAITLDGVEHVLVIGSGSLPMRERFVLVGPGGAARVHHAPALYAALREATAFSGSELNLEGVVCIGADLVLFQRGNGAPHGELAPVDATCVLSVEALVRHLRDGAPVPPLLDVTQHVLGEIDGVRVTFTDATRVGDRIALLLGAEASPNAVDDGVVVGVGLGTMALDGTDARWSRVLAPDGTPFLGKAEGLAPRTPGVEDGRFWAVVDRDDPDHAAELIEISLR